MYDKFIETLTKTSNQFNPFFSGQSEAGANLSKIAQLQFNSIQSCYLFGLDQMLALSQIKDESSLKNYSESQLTTYKNLADDLTNNFNSMVDLGLAINSQFSRATS